MKKSTTILNLSNISKYASALLTLVSLPVFGNHGMIDYKQIPANVPYSEVAKLTALPHSKTIDYGQTSHQKIYYWAGRGDKKHNTVVFVHGGCWLEQFTIDHSFALTSALSQHGFDVYSIEYRRTGNGGEWPVALHDIELALSTIYQKVSKGDAPYTGAVSFLGHSAGGHLATLASIRAEHTMFSNLHVLGLAPIIDLVAYANGENSCQSAAPAFMQATPQQNPQAYDVANPINYNFTTNLIRKNTAGLASVTMLLGSNDKIVPATMAKHHNAEFVLLEDAGHFDWIHPGSPAFKALLTRLSAH